MVIFSVMFSQCFVMFARHTLKMIVLGEIFLTEMMKKLYRYQWKL